MLLRRKLLRAELVGRGDLDGQRGCFLVSARHQLDLRDHGVVGHHHGDGAEEDLEVVRKLAPAGVAGVHRDERRARRI